MPLEPVPHQATGRLGRVDHVAGTPGEGESRMIERRRGRGCIFPAATRYLTLPAWIEAIFLADFADVLAAGLAHERRNRVSRIDPDAFLRLIRGETPRAARRTGSARAGTWLGRVSAWRSRPATRPTTAAGRPSHRAAVPVISVGNITLGGTGKTPMVEWLARWYRRRGRARRAHQPGLRPRRRDQRRGAGPGGEPAGRPPPPGSGPGPPGDRSPSRNWRPS